MAVQEVSVGDTSFVEAHTATGGSVNRPSQHRLGVRSPFINNTYRLNTSPSPPGGR